MRKRALVLVWFALAAVRLSSQPRTLLTGEDFARMARQAAEQPWAAAVRDGVISTAEQWPAAHLQRFGLKDWTLPPEGGQWSQWYICPVHGVSLQFRAPDQHICPIDNQRHTGARYDQVIYGRRHTECARAIRDNGLAYQFTGKEAFAQAAARILLAYADVYQSYRIKDTNDRTDARTGGRVTSQTLDESVWLIPVAWGYDLIASSGALAEAERLHIEQNLLRPAVAVIQRNDAGTSNWQSWHNAAIGAVGFALGDPTLISAAIDGKSGFRFQMQRSVLEDGLWYEGAWGYHFYALEPIYMLAEMAMRAGIDLYADRSLRGMFEAPLKFALPDWTLPPFSDSRAVSLLGYDRFYEIAYHRYGDPLFAALLGKRARGQEALFWGAPELPAAAPPPLASEVFPASGNAVLRNEKNDHTIIMKFGPHGGGHGHYDKLNFVSYARGGTLAVDPGTQSYAAPTHNTWDKVTVAHNTVVVDQRSQAEATGKLLAFAALPSAAAVRAEAGEAYRQATLQRSLILLPEYALDIFDVRARDGVEHQIDWVYHNYGKASTPLATEPYDSFPKSDGYQHLSGARAAATARDWQVSFDTSDSLLTSFGSTYVNNSAIRATFQYTREQAASGSFSGKMGYDFSAAQGYVLFSAPAGSGLPAEVPVKLSMMIYGDGSGHRLALRLYDTTDERFVYAAGVVNWTGWREVTASDLARWSHYLGNNDGVFDPPVKTVSVELTYNAGGPAQGTLYVDDIVLEYAYQPRLLVTDFERQLRNLRLWMLGEPGTTAVIGDGLGPDLITPVPFAMARRRAVQTRFTTLLEPYGEKPLVTSFRAVSGDTFEVKGEGIEDLITFTAAGELRVTRQGAGLTKTRPIR